MNIKGAYDMIVIPHIYRYFIDGNLFLTVSLNPHSPCVYPVAGIYY